MVGREDRGMHTFMKKGKAILIRLFDSKKCELLLIDSLAVHYGGSVLVFIIDKHSKAVKN